MNITIKIILEINDNQMKNFPPLLVKHAMSVG